jgi:hypothetical protein
MPGHLIIAAVLALIVVSGCGTVDRHPDSSRTVSFVQITDPHLFLDASKDADPAKKATREKQEKLDQSALLDAWKSIPSLAHGDQSFSFVVVTGNFGVEPCSIADLPASSGSSARPTAKECIDNFNKDKRDGQVTQLADALGTSPIRDIYMVPGNDDIASETAGDEGLAYFNQFIDEVQKKIDDAKKNVQLHNLNRCYLNNGDPSTCYVDIQETPYRLIGFPSYSFRNQETGSDANLPLQEKQFEIFRGMLDHARQSGKKVLILTSTPLIDDPYIMAQGRYAGTSPPTAIKDSDTARSPWSVWNVSKKIADEWQQAVADDAVIAVLAGHLHDSHQEIYQRPFSWSTVNAPMSGFGKLYLAPPISVNGQDTSPIQARGLAVANLDSGQITYQIYWYKAEDGSFTPTRESECDGHKHCGWPCQLWGTTHQAIAWLWNLADPQKPLDRMAVLLIAFLAAFLTVVQVWQIPAPDNPLLASTPPAAAQTPKAGGTQTPKAGGTQTGDTKTNAPKNAFEPSPFASNFAKTVINGLGGLAAAVVVKSLDGSSSSTSADNKFYIVWFVLLFFAFLIIGALLRSFGEALRERLTIFHPQPDPPRFQTDNDNRIIRALYWIVWWVAYCLSRLWAWLLSLRFAAMTFLDTFINLIQGENQTLTRVFSDTIIKQQRNAVSVSQVLRQQLNDAILEYLNTHHDKKHPAHKLRGARDVRVNISVLSEDGANLFYIARTPGSSPKGFPKNSVAWASVCAGKILWYKHDYFAKKENIVLLDNSSGVIPDSDAKIMLGAYYQQREEDYEAFIIFPVPWPHRAYESGFVKGAIHISFHDKVDFHRIWKDYPAGNKDPVLEELKYTSEEKMIRGWCVPEISASLRLAIATLSQLLCDFNENIYKNSKRPDNG